MSTNTPQRPYTTEGTAASSSTITVSGPRSRRGQSSVRYSAVATAIGTPMQSATADVISVPTSRGSAPYRLCDTSQLLVNVKPKTPNWSKAPEASSISLTKKYAISARIAAARPVSPQRSARSGRRASGDRPRTGRSPPTEREPASNSAADRRAVAGQAVRRALRLLQDRRRQLRVLELAEDALALAEAVVDEALHRAGLALVEPALAKVLVDHHERLRGDRIGRGIRRVDDRDAEILRHLHALARGRRRVERGLDELARLVLHRGRREVVLKRERLLYVAHGAGLLLHGRGNTVVALGAGACRPLDGLVRADLRRPLLAVRAEEAGEALRRARLVRAVHDGDRVARQLHAWVQLRDR